MGKSYSSRKMLEAASWAVVTVRGSHHHLNHPTLPGRVTIPHPAKNIPIGTLRSVFRQARMKWPPK